ncbi:MAG: efflux RND transporter permease subunit, partial [Limisphaerales bacterium]
MKLLLPLLIVTLLTACKKHETPTSPSAPPLPTATVRVLKVESQRRLAVEEIVGTVRPKLAAAVSAKVSGGIERMLVAPGQAVKAGELLVQLEAREIQARLDQATALREQTAKDLQRFQKLIADKAVTQQEFDAVQARQRVAAAAVTEAETQLGYTKILAPFGVITHKRADVGDLAIGILVDDAIVVVENIVRHFHLAQNKGRNWSDIAVEAVREVGNPTI